MLQVIISPAKQMHISTDAFSPRGIAPFPQQSERVIQALRSIENKQGAEGLKTLWKVNDKLLKENIEHLQNFVSVVDEAQFDDPSIARFVGPALFSYVGIQYRSMAPDVLDLDALTWLDAHLWIVSAVYGCLRPFDAVQPYRLEMGAKLAIDEARDLYAYWGDRLAQAICSRHEDDESVDDSQNDGEPDSEMALINLASVEYAKAVVPYVPDDMRVITCIFGEAIKDGKPVQRATASKIARGSMVRWMAEHRVQCTDELKHFDVGYTFNPELSDTSDTHAQTLVFMKSES